jgi:hypothetical protein
MFLAREQNTEQNDNMKAGDKFFEIVATPMNQNYIHEDITRRFKSRNAYHRTINNLLSSSVRLKNMKIKIFKTIIFPYVVWV